jgi:hypothetical protein
MAGWGDIAARLVKVALNDVKHTLVRSLALNSEILDIVHSNFYKMLTNSGSFYVHTFHEGRPIHPNLGKVSHLFPT